MKIDTTRRARFGRWTLAGWVVLLGGCGDDGIAVTEGASETVTGTGTSQGGPSSTDGPVPTTEVPTSTDSGMTDGTASVSTGDTTTTPTTGDTTQGVDTTTGSTGDTTVGETDTTVGETDTTTTGNEVIGRSVSQTVNAGSLVSSPNFRMVFTLGQPTQNQATTSSPSFKLRGGLVGANGSPP